MSNMQVLYVAEEKKEPHCTLLTSTVAIFLLYPAANVAGSVFALGPGTQCSARLERSKKQEPHILAS